jgi:hypothetical protein
MLTCNLRKLLLTLVVASSAASMGVSCRFWNPSATKTGNFEESVRETPSGIPFSTKEPDTYAAQIITTHFIDGESSETRISLTRKGPNYRIDFPSGTNSTVTYLRIGDKTAYLNDEKQLVTYEPESGGFLAAGADDFFTNRLINSVSRSEFQDVGIDNGLRKYRAISPDHGDQDIFVFVDEKIGLPVRQEFYNAEKQLMFKVEMREFTTSVDDQRFKVPEAYRTVSLREFSDALWKDRR